MSSMTPAERLLAAADLLDRRASAATDGPWEVGIINDRITPPQAWHLEGVERWRGLRNNVSLGEDEATARYIATMHPEVGKAIAAWLRREGLYIQQAEGKAFGGGDLALPDPEAMTLADLVLTGDRS